MGKFIASRLTDPPSEDHPEPFPILSLPEQLVECILSFVPAECLVRDCPFVCEQFRRIVDSNAFWKMKCERDGKVIPSFQLDPLPKRYYRMIYLENPYGRNLLRNSQGDCREGEFAHWEVTTEMGDGWRVESFPVGADSLPLESQSCFATSFGPCIKEQVIDLVREGVACEILDTFKPPIEISEWYATRIDCGGVYHLMVELIDIAHDQVAIFDTGEITTPQWMGRRWKQVKHTFLDYPSGVRYVRFAHLGRDTQFWAGHYGAKMAAGVVRIAAEQTPPCPATTKGRLESTGNRALWQCNTRRFPMAGQQ